MTAFDSRLKIGFQIRETFTNRLQMSSNEAMALAREKLAAVNLKDTERVLGAYPSELSGGMLQRVAAAILLGMSPDYILADEQLPRWMKKTGICCSKLCKNRWRAREFYLYPMMWLH